MRWKSLGAAAVALAALAVAAPATAQPPAVAGVWKTIDDDSGQPKSHVEIWEQDGRVYGKIVKLLDLKPGDDPDPRCTECKGRHHNQRILGMTILWNMTRDDDAWAGGRILDPENGKVYRCKIWLDGPTRLRVRGYVGPFHRTQTWYRVR